jgi:hypothetical protein
MGGSTSNSRNRNMAKVLDLSLDKVGNPLPYPIKKPNYTNFNRQINYTNNHKNSINSSNTYLGKETKYNRLSNRVDKFLAIFP